MTIAHFLTYTAGPENGETIRDWFAGEPVAALAVLPGVETLDLYTPEDSHDPYLDDGSGPVLMAQTGYESVEALESALASASFRAVCDDPRRVPAAKWGLTHDAMELRFFPVSGEKAPALLTAPVSYVVRYHRPAEDEARFVDYYCTHHPPILGKFPRIRNVMCYLPIEWRDPTDIDGADYLLGNEVVFDSVEDLDAALASDVRHELREDYKSLPAFYGRNTHFAMRRQRLKG